MSRPADASFEQNIASHLSHKRKCNLAAWVIMMLPILVWPVLALFVIGGCAGGIRTGISCPPILGISFHKLPTDLLLFSVKGLAFSIPVGLACLALCRFFSKKHEK